LEGKQTEPKLIGLNRFSVRFGSKTKKNGLVVYFGPKPDRTENAQPYSMVNEEYLKKLIESKSL